MSISLTEAKAQLRIRHSEQDDYITLLASAATAAIARFIDPDLETFPDDLKAAELLLLEHLFYPADSIDTDEVTGWPLCVAALAWPYRLPTVV